jgi:hypothetical protein
MIITASLHEAALWLRQGNTTDIPSTDCDIFCNMFLIKPTPAFITKHCVHTIVSADYASSDRRSQWPRGLRRKSTAARLLRLWIRIPPGAWMFVCCVCCILSDRGLCDELITRREEFYQLWRVVVYDHETSSTRRPQPALGCRAREKNNVSSDQGSRRCYYAWMKKFLLY